ncbi:uncharacterized protein LOC120531139 isoform X2 [Polypterus senegalus]|uniref:uncharacterized protein LOC120531139 isoform X2 n=1 Tax=Polypterus senegalus TaxID=55291 RepID=UPI001963669E|nr:uncharacterized protein LOC120531139 isoform X2 [Polypterus senegalus]
MDDEYLRLEDTDKLLLQLAFQIHEVMTCKDKEKQKIEILSSSVAEKKNYIKELKTKLEILDQEIGERQKCLAHYKDDYKSLKITNSLLLKYESELKTELQNENIQTEQELTKYREQLENYSEVYQQFQGAHCQGPQWQQLLEKKSAQHQVEQRIKAYEDEIEMRKKMMQALRDYTPLPVLSQYVLKLVSLRQSTIQLRRKTELARQEMLTNMFKDKENKTEQTDKEITGFESCENKELQSNERLPSGNLPNEKDRYTINFDTSAEGDFVDQPEETHQDAEDVQKINSSKVENKVESQMEETTEVNILKVNPEQLSRNTENEIQADVPQQMSKTIPAQKHANEEKEDHLFPKASLSKVEGSQSTPSFSLQSFNLRSEESDSKYPGFFFSSNASPKDYFPVFSGSFFNPEVSCKEEVINSASSSKSKLDIFSASSTYEEMWVTKVLRRRAHTLPKACPSVMDDPSCVTC